jgi:hypothetical protein
MGTIAVGGTMLRPCEAPGCGVLTLGTLCVAHEPAVDRVFPRGRPFQPAPPLADALQLRLPRKISA